MLHLVRYLYNISADECAAAPSVELWLLHYLAQHYDHIGQSAKAVEFIDKAIDHTPTLPELYMVKAKIYKVSVYCVSDECVQDHHSPYVAWWGLRQCG